MQRLIKSEDFFLLESSRMLTLHERERILLFLQSRLLLLHLLLSLPHLVSQQTVVRVVRATALLLRNAFAAPVNPKLSDSWLVGQYRSASMGNKSRGVCSSPFLFGQLFADDVVHVIADSDELLPFEAQGYYDSSDTFMRGEVQMSSSAGMRR